MGVRVMSVLGSFGIGLLIASGVSGIVRTVLLGRIIRDIRGTNVIESKILSPSDQKCFSDVSKTNGVPEEEKVCDYKPSNLKNSAEERCPCVFDSSLKQESPIINVQNNEMDDQSVIILQRSDEDVVISEVGSFRYCDAFHHLVFHKNSIIQKILNYNRSLSEKNDCDLTLLQENVRKFVSLVDTFEISNKGKDSSLYCLKWKREILPFMLSIVCYMENKIRSSNTCFSEVFFNDFSFIDYKFFKSHCFETSYFVNPNSRGSLAFKKLLSNKALFSYSEPLYYDYKFKSFPEKIGFMRDDEKSVFELTIIYFGLLDRIYRLWFNTSHYLPLSIKIIGIN